jgi:hypothetical protein
VPGRVPEFPLVRVNPGISADRKIISLTRGRPVLKENRQMVKLASCKLFVPDGNCRHPEYCFFPEILVQ